MGRLRARLIPVGAQASAFSGRLALQGALRGLTGERLGPADRVLSRVYTQECESKKPPRLREEVFDSVVLRVAVRGSSLDPKREPLTQRGEAKGHP